MPNAKNSGEKIEATGKSKTSKPKPEHVIRQNSILIQVFRKKSNSGYPYRTFSIKRIFHSSAGRECFGSDFFESNENDLILAAKAASAFLREKTEYMPEEDYELESRKHIYEYERTRGVAYTIQPEINAEAEVEGENT